MHEMNYTCDTAGISKLFSGAIVGIRGNRISVLLRAGKADKEWYLDLTQGQLVLLTEFDTLIRPGDRAAYEQSNGTVCRPFAGVDFSCGKVGFRDDIGKVRDNIRPLPAAETETELSSADLMEVIEDYRRLTRELDVAINGATGAAKQASLCDIVCQVKREGIKRGIANSPLHSSIADALKPPQTVLTYTINCPECQCLGYVTTIDGLAQRTYCNNCGHQLGLFSLKTEERS